ncbi:mannosyl-oligosaccharide glucosidase-like [Corticium candelabrum]|uniref:mannosyl-oligosaccharide glucosidase-like n=1 Tax=Corticium candelabrum TaxID=121492 RepID=UPI002E277121|nr:mannosyl-oligosaccharide glucosidase-like [Corticium candelabrum]XP_062503508.1 mannosyl-oligosaccharide glucosidase-like [Corticium candelabrum]
MGRQHKNRQVQPAKSEHKHARSKKATKSFLAASLPPWVMTILDPVYHVSLQFLLLCLSAYILVSLGIWFPGAMSPNVCSLEPKMLASPNIKLLERTSQTFWGSYRPHVYFGLRPRLPTSVVFGLMWLEYDQRKPSEVIVRHFCRHEDGLKRFGWTHHDGHSFGTQEIVESMYSIKTDFIVDEDGAGWWKAQISSEATQLPIQKQFVVMFYVALEGDRHSLKPVTDFNGALHTIEGYHHDMGSFAFTLPNNVHKSSYFETRGVPLHNLVDVVNKVFHQFGLLSKTGYQMFHSDKAPHVVVQQIATTFPFKYDIMFQTEKNKLSTVTQFDQPFEAELEKRKDNFDQKFEAIFHLSDQGFSARHITFAKSIFSNLVGGIGFFHGSSKVKAGHMKESASYGPFSLYTAVPSRSFFPRGFLWDEGFHQLVLQRWDINITMDVVAHWMDLMNINGWIPRELILGPEAESRVPAEFVVQHADHANPPTFFLTLESMLNALKSTSNGIQFLKVLYPRLQQWFDWYTYTQAGNVPFTYRWRGRTDIKSHQKMRKVRFNPKTLASGLDDYPRSLYPSHIERHLDLRCWIALAAAVMANVSDIIGDTSMHKYQQLHDELTDNQKLKELHWSPTHNYFCDYGNCFVKSSSEWSVDCVPVFGYVSLFPLFMKILDPHASELRTLLEKLSHRELLWTDYGLRSLAENSSYYNKWNNEHDPPYWRGSIWMNMNYLAVRALHYYGHVDGPYQSKALKLYQELRKNIIENVYLEHVRTGYVWESYNDGSGRGQGTHPFTGWSSLVVLMMAEQY